VIEEYVTWGAADIICSFESNTNYTGRPPSPWMAGRPADFFYHLPYEIPDAPLMLTTLALAVQRNAGWVYITDDGAGGDPDDPADGNPWDRLPAYWEQEVEAVRDLSRPARGARGGGIDGRGPGF
jgi:hypothetical protein